MQTTNEMPPASHKSVSREDRGDGHATLEALVSAIWCCLGENQPDDDIYLCPCYEFEELAQLPDKMIALAYAEINAVAYKDVATCWLRLYEDASLAKAANMLEPHAEDILILNSDHVSAITTTLDRGIAFSGAPSRRTLFEAVFQELENLMKADLAEILPTPFNVSPPEALQTVSAVEYSRHPLDLEAFQNHTYYSRTPLIISGSFDHWPAVQRWHDSSYFLRKTLGGKRLVPVEIGESYAAEEFSQALIPFREFIETFILPEHPREVGYLAQHELFTQIPALARDITVPDYCYISPPQPAVDSAAALTPGLDSVNQLEEPLLNAWLGPKGTKTPLHTDPYHNILCQVVGYKYVRLYSPEQREFLYPNTSDESGVRMDNTSQIDISPAVGISSRKGDSPGGTVEARKIVLKNTFPLFARAEYVEATLAPGECLYIPLGWWHYVESLTTSVSVSFWWN